MTATATTASRGEYGSAEHQSGVHTHLTRPFGSFLYARSPRLQQTKLQRAMPSLHFNLQSLIGFPATLRPVTQTWSPEQQDSPQHFPFGQQPRFLGLRVLPQRCSPAGHRNTHVFLVRPAIVRSTHSESVPQHVPAHCLAFGQQVFVVGL